MRWGINGRWVFGGRSQNWATVWPRDPVGGRGARQMNIDGSTLDLIDDAYNANPTWLRAAMQVLAEADASRKSPFWVT